MHKTLQLGDIRIANDLPMVLIGGLNVLESRDLALQVAETFAEVCGRLSIPYVFKASFDKANRSSIHSFRGPGLERGLSILREVRDQLALPVLTDIHEPAQAAPAAEVADVLQLPAFLSRQTDLVLALAETGRPVNIKKAQFLSPDEMEHILAKFEQAGNEQLMVCERGTCFGYNNLVVDMLGLARLKDFEYPVLFDVTHALQLPGAGAGSAGGRRALVTPLARAGIAQRIAGLFLEAHPEPDKALCDGPSALPLDRLEPFLRQVQAIDEVVKNQEEIETD